jgi:hypothetical protein
MPKPVGVIRYRIVAAPVEAIYWHCRMYQRAHGAPVVAWVAVPSAGFELTTGDATAYRSSAKAFRHFCATCGTPMTWRAIDNPRLVDVSLHARRTGRGGTPGERQSAPRQTGRRGRFPVATGARTGEYAGDDGTTPT